MALDPFLYVALIAGVLAGRFLPHPGSWVARATLANVAVLVGLLGASLGTASTVALLLAIPYALGFAALILGLTAAAYLLLARRTPPPTPDSAPQESEVRVPISFALLGALVIGYGFGRATSFAPGADITYALYALLALVGFDLRLEWRALKGAWVPLAAAIAGALAASVVFAAVSSTRLPVSLATGFAFGWYTLAGPLVAARAGAVLGLLAFLTNFLRENLTMLLSPAAGRRMRGGGLTALGGATAMDTTLFFVTRFGDEESGSLALAVGLILTLSASLILPAVLALPA